MAIKNTQFEVFKKWAEENGVSIKRSDEWEPWWACFHEGYKTALKIGEEESNHCTYANDNGCPLFE